VQLKQQELSLPDPVHEPDSVTATTVATKQPSSGRPRTHRHKILGMTIAALGFLALTFFLIRTERSISTSSLPINLSAESSAASALERAPPSALFENSDFPKEKVLLQVGLFQHLDGAEREQKRLASFGLTPYVEKRIVGETFYYALLLGPLTEQEHSAILNQLADNKISYFHRPGQG